MRSRKARAAIPRGEFGTCDPRSSQRPRPAHRCAWHVSSTRIPTRRGSASVRAASAFPLRSQLLRCQILIWFRIPLSTTQICSSPWTSSMIALTNSSSKKNLTFAGSPSLHGKTNRHTAVVDRYGMQDRKTRWRSRAATVWVCRMTDT